LKLGSPIGVHAAILEVTKLDGQKKWITKGCFLPFSSYKRPYPALTMMGGFLLASPVHDPHAL